MGNAQKNEIIIVEGTDSTDFLDRILTQSVTSMDVGTARYGALLTPQGKMAFPLFIYLMDAGVFALETHDGLGLLRTLSLYKLRAKLSLRLAPEWQIVSGIAPGPTILSCADPRANDENGLLLPVRHIINADGPLPTPTLYDRHEIGLPDLASDAALGEDFALELLLDRLGGVDFHKGCFVGQEMSSRMKRRGNVRNLLTRMGYEGPPPAIGAFISADDLPLGDIRSHNGQENGWAIALIRHDRANHAQAHGHDILANGQKLSFRPVDWAKITPQN